MVLLEEALETWHSISEEWSSNYQHLLSNCCDRFIPQSRDLETLFDVILWVRERRVGTLAKLVTLSAYRSFFNKASKPLSTKEGKSDGERSQNGTEEVKSTSRVREEENVEDSCRHRPVTDSSESPVMKRKSKRRRVIVDSDDDVGEGEVEKEVGGSKQNGREEEEEGGEEEREESKTETGVCGNGSERKGNDVEMEVGKVKGKEEEMEVGKVKEEEEMEVGKVKGKEEEEERIEAKVEEKGKSKLRVAIEPLYSGHLRTKKVS